MDPATVTNVQLQGLRLVLISSVFLLISCIWYSLRNRHRRGAKSLAVLILGALLWVAADVFQVLTPSDPVPLIGAQIRILGPDVLAIGAILFGLEYTGREQFINRWLLGFLALKPLVSLAVLFTPVFDGVLEFSSPGTITVSYDIVGTPFYVFHTAYSWALITIGLVSLGHMMVRANQAYQRQLRVLFAGFTVPFALNILFQREIVQHDLTTSGLGVMALALVYATFRLRFLDTVPIARRMVLEEMDELVILLDEQGEIKTVNDAAAAAFGDVEDLRGQDVTTLFGAEFSFSADQERTDPIEVTTTVDGHRRHYTVSQSELTDYRGTVLGHVLVCADITERTERERELALLKQVFSRVFRHNIRNELSVVRGQIEVIGEQIDDDVVTSGTETALESTERMLKHTTKARQIEKVFDNTPEQVSQPLPDLVSEAIADLDGELGNSEIRVEVDDVAVSVVDGFQIAIQNAVENALEHNPDPVLVTITSAIHEDSVELRIEDDGVGIPAHETAVLNDEEETALEHGSGVGLWVIKWYTEKSGGRLAITGTDSGTHVQLTLARG